MSRLTDQQIACIPFAGIRSTMHSNAIAVLSCGKYDRSAWLRLDVKLRRNSPQWTHEAPRSTARLMPPTDLRPSWLQSRKTFWSSLDAFQKGERLIFGPMLHAFDRPFFLLVARGVNRNLARLQIDQICGRMMPEVRR